MCMKKDDIRIDDWMRIFIGDIPGTFFIEVILRIAVIYLILMISMRLMGKRMASRLSRTDMVAMVSLSAAIGMPLQAPDRGILPAVMIAVVVISIQRFLAAWTFRSETFESYFQGSIAILVEDSVMQIKTMTQSRISRERLFAQLRYDGIRHLGEVKRLYLEANGAFCLIRHKTIRPGLSIIPLEDPEMLKQLSVSNHLICSHCGHDKMKASEECINCSSRNDIESYT